MARKPQASKISRDFRKARATDRRSSRDRGPSRKDRAVSDECLRILLTWYTIEGDRAVSREARRAPEASKGTLTTLVAAKRLGRRHPANTYPTIQKTKQKTNVPRCSDARISNSPPPTAKPFDKFSAHAEVNQTGSSAFGPRLSCFSANFAREIQLKFIQRVHTNVRYFRNMVVQLGRGAAITFSLNDRARFV